jgi:hypothetical protein
MMGVSHIHPTLKLTGSLESPSILERSIRRTTLTRRSLVAGDLILEEAGGKVTDYRGGMLDLEGREIVARNGALHAAMTELTGEEDQRCA